MSERAALPARRDHAETTALITCSTAPMAAAMVDLGPQAVRVDVVAQAAKAETVAV